jgi:anti-sigma regulatory factor (Ser/Thr protein kinase)
MTFAKELSAQLSEDTRQEFMVALREILLNAMEHGAAFNPEQVVEVTAVRTGRALVFHIRDPGSGFRPEGLAQGTTAGPHHDPITHVSQREELGLRPGGYGLLLAAGTVDELIYGEFGNEVLLIKYVDSASTAK